MNKATLYLRSIFGVEKIEIDLIELGITNYAQHKNIPYVDYMLKGRSKISRFIDGSGSLLLLVQDWDNPNSPDPFIDSLDGRSSRSKYPSCDVRYLDEFNDLINPLIADGTVKVIADYRKEMRGVV